MKRVLSEAEIPGEVVALGRAWQARHANFDPARHAVPFHAIFQAILQTPEAEWLPTSLRTILVRYPKEGKGFYSKADLVAGYRHLVAEGDLEPDPVLMKRIRMKPMRTQSGVAPVTVLDRAGGLSGQVHLLPRRLAHAQELYL